MMFIIPYWLLITFIQGFKLDFKVQTFIDPSRSLTKRNGANLDFTSLKKVYVTQLGIGSNNDKVNVSIDTGSSDLWVMGTGVRCFTVDQLHTLDSPTIPDLFDDLDESDYSCYDNGTFNYNDSQTFETQSEEFSVGYADGSAAIGVWGWDDISFLNYTIENMTFGIAEMSSIDIGILGIGKNLEHDNFPLKLKNQGIINETMYSIYSNGDIGSVLFGEIDESKYKGQLTTVDLSDTASINITSKIGNREFEQIDVIMDTGSTFSTLPKELINAIGEEINGEYINEEEAYRIECKDYSNTFNFTIGESKFQIPISDFITKFENQCYLGIMDESIVGGAIFGTDILKNLYLVYNLDDGTLSVAPSSFDENEPSKSLTTSTTSTSTTSSEHNTSDGNMLYPFLSFVPLSMYIAFLY